ncbi:DUF3096 domain-containing protein [Candidatus Pacearchaeota archaeon]|nr:DUF3096 domain-containing protein [Candidatus Pacearchaeota archaeon]
MATLVIPLISGALAIIVGILILVWPKILNYAIGIYLIAIGMLQLLGQYFTI